jgi:hypothetical protein
MGSCYAFRCRTAVFLAVLITIVPRGARTDESSDETQLRKELNAVKEQLRRVEQQMKQQEELIRKLGAEKPSTAPTAATAATTEEEQKKAEELKKKIADEIEEKLQPLLAGANKTFPSQFNPAIGFIVDTVGSYSRRDKANFEFRSGELGVSANIDPFARGFAIINGTADGIEVEEAGIVTTSLPYNLTVKGGRFFADFGRLSKFHDHDLPFVNRPIALDTYVGGESQGDGVEVSWLAPLASQYLTLTGGWYNKMGAENDRANNTEPRDFSKFTYMGRANTYLNLADAHGADLGFSDAYTPKVDAGNGKSRNLLDVDFTYRYTPLSQASYRGLIWGNEFLLNRETRDLNAAASADQVAAGGTELPPDFHNRNALGMYSYLEARLSRVMYPGFLFEYVEDVDRLERATKGYSPYLTLWASEFQRFRLQYTHLDQSPRDDDKFFLQWTVILGSHVHSFRDR